MLRVLVASPHPAMRVGLRALLEESQPGRAAGRLVVVGEAGTIEVALDWVRAAGPEAVLYDLAFEVDDSLGGLARLRATAPAMAVLALCESGSDGRVLAALQGGARGCLPKTASGAEIVEALEHAVLGEPVLHPATTAALLQQLRGDGAQATLTPREGEVLRHVAAGQTNKAIALRLGISEHTVKFHLGAAMAKLGAASRAEAVASAISRGLISV